MSRGTAVSRRTAMSRRNVTFHGMSCLMEYHVLWKSSRGNNYFHGKLGHLTCKILRVTMHKEMKL